MPPSRLRCSRRSGAMKRRSERKVKRLPKPPDSPIISAEVRSGSKVDSEDHSKGRRFFLGPFDRLIAPAVRSIEQSPTVQVLAAGFIFVGLYQVYADYNVRREEAAVRREEAVAREQEQIDRAWTRILAKTPGNTGKGQALSYLVSKGISVDGINISCRATGNFNESTHECMQQPMITDFVFHGIDEYQSLTGVDFSEIHFVNWTMNDATLYSSSLRGALIFRCDFDNVAFLEGSADGVSFRGCALTNSRIGLYGAYDIFDSNVSGTHFSTSNIEKYYGSEFFDYIANYAWADLPPFLYKDRAHFEKPQISNLKDYIKQGRLVLLDPPRDEDGNIIDFYKRPVRRKGVMRQNIKHTYTIISVDQAAREYPEAYRVFE